MAVSFAICARVTWCPIERTTSSNCALHEHRALTCYFGASEPNEGRAKPPLPVAARLRLSRSVWAHRY
jgi:hypothetical protein